MDLRDSRKSNRAIRANDLTEITTEITTDSTSAYTEVVGTQAKPSAQPSMFAEEVPPTPQAHVPVGRKSKPARKKKTDAYVNTVSGVSTKDILDRYELWMQENEAGSAIAYAREGKAALMLAQNGWKPEEVVDCCARMKVQDFWRDKHLSLHSVAATIGSLIGTRSSAPPTPRTIVILDYHTGEPREVQVE